MPWECKTCSAQVPLDLLECPTCGKNKTAWSLVADRTRTMVLGKRKKLEVRRGEGFATTPAADVGHLGVAWPLTERAAVLTKAGVKALIDGGRLPDPGDLFCVRMSPGKRQKRWTLELNVNFETKKVEELAFEFERAPDQLEDGRSFEAVFVAVRGPEPLDGLALPNVHLLDVTEGSALGHAPELEVSGFRSQPIKVALGPEPRPALDCRRGETIATGQDQVPFHQGVSWHETTSASVLPAAQARALQEAGELPDPRDLLAIRITPGAAPEWRLGITTAFAGQPPATRELVFPPAPERLNEQGYFAVHLLCVKGEGAGDVRFPSIGVLDVSEPTPLGHAPELELAWPESDPIRIELGGGPPTASWEGAARSTGDPARMVLVAPGLAAGEPVTFEVTQVGFGPIAQVEVTSEAGGASSEFVGWFSAEAAPAQPPELGLEDQFPQVEFTFTARSGEVVAESPPLPFDDFLHAKLVFADETPAAETELVIDSPWGQKRARTDAQGVVRLAPLPPGGVRRIRFGQDSLAAEV